MPQYQIQAPDGNTYKIDGPPNASREDIIAHVSAKFPQSAKPKAAAGPQAHGIDLDKTKRVGKAVLDIGVRATKDITEASLSPKEIVRESYHTITDFAADTLQATDDLGQWISDKTGYHGIHVDSHGIRMATAQDTKQDDLDPMIEHALKSEKVIGEPHSVTGGLVKDFGEFTLGMLSAGKVFGVANQTVRGGISAWTVFDPQQQKLSDLMVKYPWLRNPVTNWLKSEPGDSNMKGRLKNTIEGVLTGKAAEAFMKSLDLLRVAMKGKVEANAFKVATEDKPHFTYAGVDPKTGKVKVKLKPVEEGRQEAKIDAASQAAAGKPPDISAGIAGSAEEVAEETKGKKAKTPSLSLEQAFSPVPVAEKAKGKLQEWWRWTQDSLAPESVSPQAKQAGADIASAYAENMQHTEERFQRSSERKEYWEVNQKKIAPFVRAFETGKPMDDPVAEKAREFYHNWMDSLEKQDKVKGIEYTPESHYLPHLYEDQKGVEAWLAQQGQKEPGFAKKRSFDLYEQAAKANFRPKFTNPEDIMQARQHASDLAAARIDAMERLQETGLVYEGEGGRPGYSTSYSAPNGKTYWVNDDAKHLLNRMFDEKSLWTERSLLGSAYRGLSTLKNNIIPIRLAFSAFHPIHVLTMHLLAATATRSIKAGEWIPSHYKEGSRALKMMRGQIPANEISPTDKQALQYFADGGLVLEQDPRFRTQALERLRTSFQKNNVGVMAHLHTGALQVLSDAVFKTWIPSLKGASYLADVRAHLKANPNLLDDPATRRVALRRLAKSVENRYGELHYNTLFWDRTFRDVSVLSATSMGWQLGMFREYGGGIGQLGRLLKKAAGDIVTDPQAAKKVYEQMKKTGDLDKLFYVSNYTAITAAWSSLATWAMTGKPPNSTMDAFAPRTGELNPDGTPVRVRTMFYPYEFAAFAKRTANEGLAKAAQDWVSAKGSGIPSMLAETWTGVNSLGQQIRNPDHPVYRQIHETLDALLKESNPISLQQKGATPESGKQRALDIAGMTRAPKYLQQTQTEAKIEQKWQRVYKTAETPYQQVQKSAQRQELQQAVQAGDDVRVDKLIGGMVDQFHLRSQDAKRLMKDASLGLTSHQALFREMREDDQRELLKSMTPEERKQYLPYAKNRVKGEYEE